MQMLNFFKLRKIACHWKSIYVNICLSVVIDLYYLIICFNLCIQVKRTLPVNSFH